jgi:TDG/mug DNA glycosylase family protein
VRAGHHFANPANGFWRLLHEAGFTPRLFAPHEDRRLLEHGLGITNLVSRASPGVADLGREEMLKGAETLGRNLERWRCGVVFVGITAWSVFACRWRLKAAARAGRQRFAGRACTCCPTRAGATRISAAPRCAPCIGAWRARAAETRRRSVISHPRSPE